MPIDPLAKLKSVAELKVWIGQAQASGRSVVFANGCFDLLHVGHIRYLQSAKAEGDILVLAINSDASVRALKGEGRPLQSEEERAEILGSLECVDYIVIFDSSTVDGLLSDLRPDIHAKGTDYSVDTVPERDAVQECGGRVEIVGDPKDHSASEIIHSRLGVRRW